MKKWIAVFTVLILLIFAGFFYWKKTTPNPPAPSNVLSETDNLPPSPSVWPQSVLINIDDVPIRISWAIVDPKDVELYSNLKEQKLSEEIKVDKSCKVLVSGGFYSQDQTHLGLFISDFETVSNSIQSALLNGFLTIDSADKILISTDSPETTLRLGLQTGPLLMQEAQPLSLAINNDEPARRIAAGTTADNKLIFLVFYRDSSELEGPMLGKLPEIIDTFKEQTDINIVDAINLDGGIHSMFASSYDRLVELEHVGSYFCATR